EHLERTAVAPAGQVGERDAGEREQLVQLLLRGLDDLDPLGHDVSLQSGCSRLPDLHLAAPYTLRLPDAHRQDAADEDVRAGAGPPTHSTEWRRRSTSA